MVRVPVDRRALPRIDIAQRINDDMGCGEGDAVERAHRAALFERRVAQDVIAETQTQSAA